MKSPVLGAWTVAIALLMGTWGFGPPGAYFAPLTWAEDGKSAGAITLGTLLKRGYEIKAVIAGLNLVERTCARPNTGELFDCFDVADDVKTTVTRTRFLLQKGASFFICDTAYDLTKNEQPALRTNSDAPGGPTTCREAKFD